MHEALISGDRVAARYTMRALMRKQRSAHVEVYMFGVLAPDERLRQIDQITRKLQDT